MGQLWSEPQRPELQVHTGLYQEEDKRSNQEGCGGEVDRVVAECHHDHHVHEQGHQKAEGEEDTSDAEQALLGARSETPHSHRWSDQVPQKEGVQ